MIGMRITLKYCFAKTVTVQYPDMAPVLQPRFRGFHYFEIEKCIACDLCAKACPVDCIYIEKSGPRKIDADTGVALGGAMIRYAIDYAKCMFCALCTDPCPTDCIHMGKLHDLSSYSREDVVVEFAELDKQGLRKNNNGSIPAELALGNGKDFSHKGVIDFVNNQIDSTTGTLQARAVFQNSGRELIPGQYGRLRITGSGKYTGMLIPDYAIGADQEKKIVYVVGPDKTIQIKEVVPGQLIDGLRVIRSGLAPTDQVVLDHLQVVRSGMPVDPKETPVQPEAEAATPPTPAPSHS